MTQNFQQDILNNFLQDIAYYKYITAMIPEKTRLEKNHERSMVFYLLSLFGTLMEFSLHPPALFIKEAADIWLKDLRQALQKQ